MSVLRPLSWFYSLRTKFPHPHFSLNAVRIAGDQPWALTLTESGETLDCLLPPSSSVSTGELMDWGRTEDKPQLGEMNGTPPAPPPAPSCRIRTAGAAVCRLRVGEITPC